MEAPVWLIIPNGGPFLRRNVLAALLAATPNFPAPLLVYKRTGHRHLAAFIALPRSAVASALAAFPLARPSDKPLRARPAERGEVPREAVALLRAPFAPAPALAPPAPLQQPLPDVHSVVTPLAVLPYGAQCVKKAGDMEAVLRRVAAGLAAACAGGSGDGGCDGGGGGAGVKRQREGGGAPPSLPPELSWLPERQAAHGGAACALSPLLPSPVVEGYRNKCEFTIGFDAAGGPAVGFCLGGFAATGGEVRVAGAPSFRHLPPQLCAIRDAVDGWVRASPLSPYDTRVHRGVWRTLSVRWCADQQAAMVELLAKPPPPEEGARAGEGGGGDAAAVYAAEVARFEALLRGGGQPGGALPPVASAFLQEYGGLSAPDVNSPRALLFGAPHITEALPLSGLRFRVSPGAFSQVNTAAADELYVLVRALAVGGVEGARALLGSALPPQQPGGGASAAAAAEPPPPPPPPKLQRGVLPPKQPHIGLLDVCCGGGVFSILCAPFVGATLGMDVSAEAVADACANAALNGRTNCTFIRGKAEEVLMGGDPPLAPLRDFVAVVDPPRGGLHPSVIAALRTMQGLRRVVYVSCSPAGSFVNDAVRLCEPTRKRVASSRGAPFRPVLSVPVDLFPHTAGVELVTLFERD
jgi:tRNA (uracil-5-)-methyltransferase